jgi:hypothetical protein
LVSARTDFAPALVAAQKGNAGGMDTPEEKPGFSWFKDNCCNHTWLLKNSFTKRDCWPRVGDTSDTEKYEKWGFRSNRCNKT